MGGNPHGRAESACRGRPGTDMCCSPYGPCRARVRAASRASGWRGGCDPRLSGEGAIMKALRLLWFHRKMLWATTLNDIKARYRGSVLGLVWLVLYPALFLGT